MTKDEITFFARVADVLVERGWTDDIASHLEEACKIVLKRDDELHILVSKNLDGKRSDLGRAICDHLCERVYAAARA